MGGGNFRPIICKFAHDSVLDSLCAVAKAVAWRAAFVRYVGNFLGLMNGP